MKNRVKEGRHSWTLPGGSVVYEHDAQTAHKKQVLSDGGYWGKKEGETWDQALSRMMDESMRGNEAARQEAAYQALMRPQQESAGAWYQEPMDEWQEPWSLAEAQSGAMPMAQEAGAEARAGMDRQYVLEERQATAELDKLEDKLLRGEPLSPGEYVFLQESIPRTEWQQPTVPLEVSPWNGRAETAAARKTADSIDKPPHGGYDEEEKKAILLHQVAGFNPYITDTFVLEKYGKPLSKAYVDPEKHFKENNSPDYQDSEWWLQKMEEDASKDRKERRVLQDTHTIPLNIALQVFLGLKPREATLTLRYPWDALKVNEAKKLAGTAKAVLFAQDEDRELDGSKANAFLHAYWNEATAYRIGAELTEEFTTAHETYSRRQYIKNKLEEIDEKTGLTVGQNVEMDMHNNAVGREIAAKMPDTEEKIHAELLKEYGSEEAIAMQLSMYPNFEEADLLLLCYTEKAMEDGLLVWLYHKE